MIRLTPNESLLFKFLLFAAHHNGHSGTVLRVAGGWVRDKVSSGRLFFFVSSSHAGAYAHRRPRSSCFFCVWRFRRVPVDSSHRRARRQLLNKSCTDIDIALNDTFGTAFAQRAEAAFPAYRAAHPHDVPATGMHHFATIAANPDKSKHLETATVRIFDFDVDFVNLRSEDYAADSRIPAMQFGTPLQDALRRDLTINALFYNINDGVVEDLTGTGLADLQNGFIRTPLEPRTTFIDDPLRVMRAIRFGTRFQYRFDDALVAAARLPDVKEALQTKVSRERIGQELYGIFAQAARPLAALHVAADWNVFDVIFRSTLWTPARIAFGLATGDRATDAHDAVAPQTPHAPCLVVAALLAPLAGHRALVLKKPPPLVTHVVSDSLKWSNRDATNVQTTLDGALAFRAVLRSAAQAALSDAALERLFVSATDDSDTPDVAALRAVRRDLGLVLRATGELWRDALCLAVALDEMLGDGRPLLAPDGTSDLALIDQIGAQLPLRSASADRFALLHRYVSVIGALRLDGAWTIKPLIDGRQMQTLIGVAAGPWMTQYRDRLLECQLMFPSWTEADAARFLTQLHASRTAAAK